MRSEDEVRRSSTWREIGTIWGMAPHLAITRLGPGVNKLHPRSRFVSPMFWVETFLFSAKN